MSKLAVLGSRASRHPPLRHRSIARWLSHRGSRKLHNVPQHRCFPKQEECQARMLLGPICHTHMRWHKMRHGANLSFGCGGLTTENRGKQQLVSNECHLSSGGCIQQRVGPLSLESVHAAKAARRNSASAGPQLRLQSNRSITQHLQRPTWFLTITTQLGPTAACQQASRLEPQPSLPVKALLPCPGANESAVASASAVAGICRAHKHTR